MCIINRLFLSCLLFILLLILLFTFIVIIIIVTRRKINLFIKTYVNAIVVKKRNFINFRLRFRFRFRSRSRFRSRFCFYFRFRSLKSLNNTLRRDSSLRQ